MQVIKIEPENLLALYILLNLSWEAAIESRAEGGQDYEPSGKPEEYALKIKEIHKYLGYIAWSDAYAALGKAAEAEEVLVDLVDVYPRFPHAYIKLWDIRFKNEKYLEWIEPIEELFIKVGDFYTIPELQIAMIPLIYAKSLYQIKQYVFVFELLQNEFCKRPIYTVFLYFLGKFAVKSSQINFMGTAIGILQECLRSCVNQRKANILFLLGIAYKETGQPLVAFDYFEKSLDYYKNKDYTFYDCPQKIK